MHRSKELTSRAVRQDPQDCCRLVLVADDDPELRSCLAECLAEDGYQPILAGDGLQAMYALEVDFPHLAIVDLNMPVMPGFRLLHLLRDLGQSAPSELPVIVISSNDAKESMDVVVAARPDGYLQKPFSVEQLLEKVHDLVPPLSI